MSLGQLLLVPGIDVSVGLPDLPAGFAFIVDSDGDYLVDSNGCYFVTYES